MSIIRFENPVIIETQITGKQLNEILYCYIQHNNNKYHLYSRNPDVLKRINYHADLSKVLICQVRARIGSFLNEIEIIKIEIDENL